MKCRPKPDATTSCSCHSDADHKVRDHCRKDCGLREEVLEMFARLGSGARRHVSRVLSRRSEQPGGGDGHSSGTLVAERLVRPTRAATRRPAWHLWIAPRMPAAPTWSCSRWGFPCRRRCRRRGALLPHRFTLTARRTCRSGRRCTFCGTVPGVAPAGRYPAPHLRGARTFLSPHNRGERPSDRLASGDLGTATPLSKPPSTPL